MLADNVIEPAQTEWAIPIFFTLEKICNVQFCVEYWKLNAETIQDLFPTPRMNEFIDSFGKATIFSALGANCEYLQVEIEASGRGKTAFISYRELGCFIPMNFALQNAPGTFQKTTDVTLSTARWQFSLIYLGDNVVFPRLSEENIDHSRHVLTLLHDTGVLLKLEKCKFYADNRDYYWHFIRPQLLEISSHATNEIRERKPRTSLMELRLFRVLCNLFRRLVPKFVLLAASPNNWERKNQIAALSSLNEKYLQRSMCSKTLSFTPSPRTSLLRPTYKTCHRCIKCSIW